MSPFGRVWSQDQNGNAEKHRRHQLDSKTWSKLVWGYRRLDFFLKHWPKGQWHPRRDHRPKFLATCPNTSDKQVPNNCQMDVSLLVNILWTLLSIRGKLWLILRPIQIFRHVATSCIYPPICWGNASICVCWYHLPKNNLLKKILNQIFKHEIFTVLGRFSLFSNLISFEVSSKNLVISVESKFGKYNFKSFPHTILSPNLSK